MTVEPSSGSWQIRRKSHLSLVIRLSNGKFKDEKGRCQIRFVIVNVGTKEKSSL